MLKRSLFITILLVTLFPAFCYAVDRENALKAGFLYNFARYSEGSWFDSSIDNEYVICTDSLSFYDIASDVLKDQKVQNVPVALKHIPSPEELSDSTCHSFFITALSEHSNEFLQSPSLNETMLVGETKGFIELGGHLNFFIAGGKIRFEVDPIQLHNNGIKLSSKVLRMGRIVEASAK